jgi:alpha-tubulin suppressor-like RCC1 family protein
MQKFYYSLRPILAGLLAALITLSATAQILPGTLVAGSAHSVVVQPDGSLRAWGSNSAGQVGNGGGTQVLTPSTVGTSTTYTQVAAGVNHTLAIRADGTLWAWGDNYYGGLGDGTTISRTTPVQVGNVTTWKQVAVGNYYSLALRADGTL